MNKTLHTKNKIIIITQFIDLKRLLALTISYLWSYKLKGILYPSDLRRMRSSSSTSSCSHCKLIPERCTVFIKMKSVRFFYFLNYVQIYCYIWNDCTCNQLSFFKIITHTSQNNVCIIDALLRLVRDRSNWDPSTMCWIKKTVWPRYWLRRNR